MSTPSVRLFFLLLCVIPHTALFSQLDTIHWIPPMHARDGEGPQYLYLSTPEPEEFAVRISDGSGAILASPVISNAKPFRLALNGALQSLTLVPEAMLHTALKGRGLIMQGPKKFYAYYRVHAYTLHHAGDLTCKGQAALGKEFRIGNLLQAIDNQDRRSNFVGILATEDSTEITFSDFHSSTDFRISGKNVQSTGPVTMMLHKGESVVFAQYITTNDIAQPVNGLMGALLRSTKPVVVNCGSWLAAPVIFQAHDIGIDQIAPFEHVGKEYILCKGNGSEVLEHPIVIAHVNGTQIWLNGSPTPAATLAAGKYLVVPTSAFSAQGNLYIRSSEPVFVYQMIGGTSFGDDAMRTAGLMFVPPVSCGIPNAVDNIYQPNQIGGMQFEGGLMIVAMKDSTVTVRIDGNPVSMGAAAAVPGNPDFVTYRNLSLFSPTQTPATLSIVAQGAVQVAMYGRNEPASFAAFFSGFSKTVLPRIELTLIGDGICPDTLVASGLFDGVQWMLEDSLLQFGPDSTFVAFSPGKYTALGYLGVCRRTDFALDSISTEFKAPPFTYSLTEPSCFDYADGQIVFDPPSGGFRPYQYSIDRGLHFADEPVYSGLKAGDYQLLVRDSLGCLSRPAAISMGQPDSFWVDLLPVRLPDPLLPGQQVILRGVPNRPVTATTWTPADSLLCPDCLLYTFRPEESIWVTLFVEDELGCLAADSLLIRVDPRIYVPNVIDPESLSGNDRFTVFSPEPLPIRRMLVFDRWGEQVFERRSIFTNNPAEGWDGRFRGDTCLPGVYVYLVEVEAYPGRVVVLRGNVTVVR